jgi:hypothetical protein
VAITDLHTLVAGIIGPPTVIGKDAGTAEAAGIPHTPWYQAGLTGAGSAPTGGLNGATFSGTVAGQVPIPATVAGKTSYLERAMLVHTGGIGLIRLVDRLWGDVPVVTTTTSQAITSPAWPSRDAVASSNGVGVFLALECSSATGNGGAITNTTVSYTNSSGTSGRTATLASFPVTAVAGTWVPFSLQAGDIGVRSVQSVTLGTSYVSGAIHLVAFRVVADLPTPNTNTATPLNFMDLGLPVVWDSSVLQLVYHPSGTSVGAVSGSFTYAQN